VVVALVAGWVVAGCDDAAEGPQATAQQPAEPQHQADPPETPEPETAVKPEPEPKSEPKPGPKPHTTPQAAALSAMLASRTDPSPGEADVDTEATLKVLASAVRSRADLNGDGREELIVDIGRWVRTNGVSSTVNDAAGNIAWAIVQADTNDHWSAIHQGYGLAPQPLASRHNDWRDLQIGWTLDDHTGSIALQRFVRGKYHTAWAARVIGMGAGYRQMSAAPIPKDLVLRIVRDVEATPPKKAAVLRGSAFRADLDEDGRDELLIQLDVVKIGGRKIDLSGPDAPGNVYLYTRRDDQWEHILRGTNTGAVRMPLAIDRKGLIALEMRIGTKDGRAVIKWYHVRDGKLAETGVRHRTND
jgi:hypothetical protein